MSKNLLIQTVYIALLIFGGYALYTGHVERKYNQMILGLGAALLAMFLMHWPIKWLK